MTSSASSATPSTVGTWREAAEPRRDPVVGPIRVEVELGGASRQAVADPLATALDRRLVDVVEDDLVPASSATWAIPAPIVPAPTMPTMRRLADAGRLAIRPA